MKFERYLIDPPVDFATMLRAVQWRMPGGLHGDTEAGSRAIALSLGVSRGRVRGWIELGRIPRHDDGERIIALWHLVTGQPAQDVPRVLSTRVRTATNEIRVPARA